MRWPSSSARAIATAIVAEDYPKALGLIAEAPPGVMLETGFDIQQIVDPGRVDLGGMVTGQDQSGKTLLHIAADHDKRKDVPLSLLRALVEAEPAALATNTNITTVDLRGNSLCRTSPTSPTSRHITSVKLGSSRPFGHWAQS